MKTLKTILLTASFLMASSAFAGLPSGGAEIKQHNTSGSCTGNAHAIGLQTATAYTPPATTDRSNNTKEQIQVTEGANSSNNSRGG